MRSNPFIDNLDDDPSMEDNRTEAEIDGHVGSAEDEEEEEVDVKVHRETPKQKKLRIEEEARLKAADEHDRREDEEDEDEDAYEDDGFVVHDDDDEEEDDEERDAIGADYRARKAFADQMRDEDSSGHSAAALGRKVNRAVPLVRNKNAKSKSLKALRDVAKEASRNRMKGKKEYKATDEDTEIQEHETDNKHSKIKSKQKTQGKPAASAKEEEEEEEEEEDEEDGTGESDEDDEGGAASEDALSQDDDDEDDDAEAKNAHKRKTRAPANKKKRRRTIVESPDEDEEEEEQEEKEVEEIAKPRKTKAPAIKKPRKPRAKKIKVDEEEGTQEKEEEEANIGKSDVVEEKEEDEEADAEERDVAQHNATAKAVAKKRTAARAKAGSGTASASARRTSGSRAKGTAAAPRGSPSAAAAAAAAGQGPVPKLGDTFLYASRPYRVLHAGEPVPVKAAPPSTGRRVTGPYVADWEKTTPAHYFSTRCVGPAHSPHMNDNETFVFNKNLPPTLLTLEQARHIERHYKIINPNDYVSRVAAMDRLKNIRHTDAGEEVYIVPWRLYCHKMSIAKNGKQAAAVESKAASSVPEATQTSFVRTRDSSGAVTVTHSRETPSPRAADKSTVERNADALLKVMPKEEQACYMHCLDLLLRAMTHEELYNFVCRRTKQWKKEYDNLSEPRDYGRLKNAMAEHLLEAAVPTLYTKKNAILKVSDINVMRLMQECMFSFALASSEGRRMIAMQLAEKDPTMNNKKV